MEPRPPQPPSQDGPEMDLAKVHGAILREHDEPRDGQEPIPLWLLTLFFALAFWAGGYLFFYSGGFRGDVFNESQVTWGYLPATAGKAKDPLLVGKKVFVANCASCHQVTGLGQPGIYPPLAGSEYVNGPANRLAAILLNGVTGPLKVNGVVYNNTMPTWKGLLKDEQIAAVLTYIRQEWGNKGGPVYAEGIAAKRAAFATRTTPLTEAEILAMPPEELPGPAAAPAAPAKPTATSSNAPAPAASAPKPAPAATNAAPAVAPKR